MEYREGQTATNPDTGEKLTFHDGAWVPIPGAGASAPATPPVATAPPVAAEPEADAAPEGPGVMEDIKKSVAPSLIRGTADIASAPNDIAHLLMQGGAKLADSFGPEKYRGQIGPVLEQAWDAMGKRQLPFVASPRGASSDELVSAIEKGTGPLYDAQTPIGKIVAGGIRMLPTAPIGETSLLGGLVKGASKAFSSGAVSEGAGQLAEHFQDQLPEWADPVARFVGALTGSKLPSAGRKILTPFPTTPERTEAANLLRDKGINVTAGQATGSPRLNRNEESLLEHAPDNVQPASQDRQMTQAMFGETGAAPAVATQQNIDAQRSAISTGIKNIAARYNMPMDHTLANTLGKIHNDYESASGLTPSGPHPDFNTQIDKIIDAGRTNASRSGGQMHLTGDQYQNLRRSLSERANNPSLDHDLSRAYRGVRDALDDSMERATRGTPHEGEFGRLRTQWGNLDAIEKAAQSKGQSAALGILDPSKVYQNLHQNSDLSKLSRAGEAVLPRPNTEKHQSALEAIGTILGGAIGHYTNTSPIEAALAGKFTTPALVRYTGIPNLMAKALFNPAVQGYLRNQRFLPSAARHGVDPALATRLLMAPRQVPAEAADEQ